MTEFRNCPSYIGYEASACGLIRRAERPSIRAGKEGATLPAKVLKPIKVRPNFVNLNGGLGWVRISDMVADAWPVDGDDDEPYDAYQPDLNHRPRPVRGGRVLTLAEYRAQQLARR